jgi:GST-like protein
VVNITKDDQFQPDFLKISPNNKIPAIIDPDGPAHTSVSVFESGAILLYLAEKTGKFLPLDPARRIPVYEWLMFQMGGFGPIPGQVHHFLGLTNEDDQRYGLKRYMAENRRLYKVMNERLATHEFFANELSIADFAILGWVWRHPRHQVDLNDFPNVKRWYDLMLSRPAVQRGLQVALK